MAPYFPFIQSSGMGKTKLLYEYQKKYQTSALMILCSYKTDDTLTLKETLGYQGQSVTDKPLGNNRLAYARVRKDITDWLDHLVKGKTGKLIPLFDEAQKLLKNDGFAFKCVRWWLRIERELQVVAVFAGTTLKLSNFYRELPATTWSRDAKVKYNGGTELYRPSISVGGLGCLRIL